jgi:hypothetical protein
MTGGDKKRRLGTPVKVGIVAACVIVVAGGVFGGVAVANAVALSDAKGGFTTAQTTFVHDSAVGVSQASALSKATQKAITLDKTASAIATQGSGFAGATQLAVLAKADAGLHADVGAKAIPALDAQKVESTGSPSAAGYQALAKRQRAQTEVVMAHTASVERRERTLAADTHATIAALRQVAGSVPATSATALTANGSAGAPQKSAFTAAANAVKGASSSTIAARLAAYVVAGAALAASNAQAVAAAQAAAQAAAAAQSAAANTVLGVASTGQPGGGAGGSPVGFGTVQPSEIYLGGDGTGDVTNITWSDWGSSQATGQGTAPDTADGASGASAAPAAATVVAWGLMTCDGVPTYTQLVWYFPEDGQTQSSVSQDVQNIGDSTCTSQ